MPRHRPTDPATAVQPADAARAPARLLAVIAAVAAAAGFGVMPASAAPRAGSGRPAAVESAGAAGVRMDPAAPARTGAGAAGAAATAGTATAPAGPLSGGKGPVGWDTYRELGQLPVLPTGVETRQFSSFDRLQVNHDFRHTLRRLPGGGYVLAERTGPGEIDSIWTTSNGGDVTQTGNIHVVLDGKTVLDAPEQDVVDGKLGAPFVYPLVANASQSSGGDVIMVPMPFRSSMLVWTDHDPVYYHVTYRSFASAAGVSTFNPADKAQDVLNTLKAAGTRDPKPPLPGATTAAKSFTLAPGQSTTLASSTGGRAGEVTGLQLKLPQLVPPPQPRWVTDDGRAFGRDSGAYSQFTVKINPDNQGVRLTRRIDAGVASQVADVYVDGQKVARWAPNPAAGQCHWYDESVDLPASATAGKSQITIRNQFVSSANDFNEFYYWAYSNVGGSWQQTDTVDVGPNHTTDEAAHNYTVNEQTWNGVRSYCYPPAISNAAQQTDDVLSKARIQISFDGRQMVNAPLGEFFGDGLGLYPVKALMYAVDPAARQFSAWWPMPYAHGFTVTLYNGSSETLTSGQSAVTSAPDPAVATGLSPSGQTGYFHATSNLAHTQQGYDHQYLGASGWGKFVGVTATNRGDPGYGRSYMEGNARVYVDGSKTPQITGTGTEDFYEGGWYFNHGPFSNPINGNPAQEDSTYTGCESDCIGAYRLMLADAVTWNDGINFGIEHGPYDNVPAVYGSTAYWYGRSQDAMRHTDTLTVGDTSGDPASEQAHGYTSPDPGTIQTLTATYEGNDGPQNGRLPAFETHTLRDTTSPVSFHLAVDPANRGVVLRRTSDQETGYQAAEIYINGQDAGEWQEPLANPYHRWLDDIYQLPASLTAGQHQLHIKLVPLPGAPPWSAASYQALSLVPPYNGPVVTGAASVRPAALYLRPGASATATLTFTSQATTPQTVSWSAATPEAITASPSGGRLRVPPDGSARTQVKVTAGGKDGKFTVTFAGSSAAGSYSTAALSVIVARPGDLAPYYNNIGISNDKVAGQANYDGGGWSYSQQALTAAGLAPGATVNAGGLTYTWPDAAAGQPDDVMAAGQTIPVSAHPGATEIGFLGSAASAPSGSQGTVTITYTDGTSSTATLGMSDWALGGNPNAKPLFGNAVAATMPYRNFADGTAQTLKMYVFAATIPVNAGKTVASVTLPGSVTNGSIGIFAISAG